MTKDLCDRFRNIARRNVRKKQESVTARPTVVFFVKTGDPEMIPLSEFYAVDIQILSELGFDVRCCGDPLRIPRGDLYFVWWWTWAIFPVLRAKLARKPVIIVGTFDHITSQGTFIRFHRRPGLHRLLIRAALRFADANVVPSLDQFAAIQSQLGATNLSYSPHVVDVKAYKPATNERSSYLLSICWMTKENAERKCIVELVRAFKFVHERFPALQLKICGRHGSGFSNVVELVNNLGLQGAVEFPGLVSRADKIHLLQHCAIYLQPTREEGFGVAILEAMACGAPVITSGVGPVRSIAADTVMYVDGRNPQEISSAIVNLLSQPSARAEMGRRARERARSVFPYERRKADIEQIVTTLCSTG